MGEVICPYCKAPLKEGAILCCLQCGTRQHKVCWSEYGSRCAVFSCQGQQSAIRKRNESSILLVIWCFLNYGLHLALRPIGYLTDPLPMADVLIVGILEAAVIATGWFMIRSRSAYEPARTAGILLFSGNTLFVFFLFSHYLAYGFESLNALIRL